MKDDVKAALESIRNALIITTFLAKDHPLRENIHNLRVHACRVHDLAVGWSEKLETNEYPAVGGCNG